jgi:glycosyltransferase involved in cell wall biosynthesis
MKNSITIISCNYHSKKFADVLIKSINKFSNEKYPIYIMDNSTDQELFTCDDYQVIYLNKNIGHGAGIDYLISNYVETEYTLVMDIDAHILREGYDLEFLEILNNKPNIGLIAPARAVAKPIHPGVMFFRTCDFKNKIPIKHFNLQIDDITNISFQLDVGQLAPILLSQKLNKDTYTLKWSPSIFNGVRGDTWILNNKETFYHFGYGTRLYNRTEVGTIKKEDIDNMKQLLFEQIKL